MEAQDLTSKQEDNASKPKDMGVNLRVQVPESYVPDKNKRRNNNNMKWSYDFIAQCSGDGECFNFKVDDETYERIVGRKKSKYSQDVYPDHLFSLTYRDDTLTLDNLSREEYGKRHTELSNKKLRIKIEVEVLD